VYSDSFVSSSTCQSAHVGFGINKLVSEIEAGNIEKGSFIIFDSLSKIAGQNIEQLDSIIKKIWENEITIVTAHDGADYPPESLNDISKRIGLLSIIESVHRVSLLRSERAIKAHQASREAES
jgi:hypothetical protein